MDVCRQKRNRSVMFCEPGRLLCNTTMVGTVSTTILNLERREGTVYDSSNDRDFNHGHVAIVLSCPLRALGKFEVCYVVTQECIGWTLVSKSDVCDE